MAKDEIRFDRKRRITEAARRALDEAERRQAAAMGDGPSKEIKGPKGPEPTRYGDWERNGITSDF